MRSLEVEMIDYYVKFNRGEVDRGKSMVSEGIACTKVVQGDQSYLCLIL